MNYELRELHEFIEIPKQELSFVTFLNRRDAENAEKDKKH